MKKLARIAARLYPKPWRDRYGDEFDALIEDTASSWRAVLDIWKGAFEMQIATRIRRNIASAAALIAAAAVVAVLFLTPAQYASEISIDVAGVGVASGEPANIVNAVLSDQSLERVMQQSGLYSHDRKRLSRNALLRRMRRATHITWQDGAVAQSRLIVRFVAGDPEMARAVDGRVAAGILEEATRRALANSSRFPLTLRIDRAATVSRLPRLRFTIFAGSPLAAPAILTPVQFRR